MTFEDKVRGLVDAWADRWKKGLKRKGREVSKEAVRKYKSAMERLAELVVSGGLKGG